MALEIAKVSDAARPGLAFLKFIISGNNYYYLGDNHHGYLLASEATL